jgi:hypothetical protein
MRIIAARTPEAIDNVVSYEVLAQIIESSMRSKSASPGMPWAAFPRSPVEKAA